MVIVSPAGNVVKRYDATGLAEEGIDYNMLEMTEGIVTNLHKNMKLLETHAGFITPCPTDPFWLNVRNGTPVFAVSITEVEKPKEIAPEESNIDHSQEDSIGEKLLSIITFGIYSPKAQKTPEVESEPKKPIDRGPIYDGPK